MNVLFWRVLCHLYQIMKTQDLYLILLLYSEHFRWVFNMPSYITNGLNHMLLSRCQWFTCTLIPDANPPHIVFFNCDICIGHVGQNKFAAGTEQSWKMLSWLLNTVAISMHVKCMLYSGLKTMGQWTKLFHVYLVNVQSDDCTAVTYDPFSWDLDMVIFKKTCRKIKNELWRLR